MTVAALLVSFVCAEVVAPPVLRQAVIVGVNDGVDAGGEASPALRYADDDAFAYAQLFAQSGYRVFLHVAPDRETAEVRADELQGLRSPSKAELTSSLAAAAREARKARAAGARADLVVVYVGHGRLDGNGSASLTLADGGWQRSELIEQLFETADFDLVHLIVDACHAAAMVAGRGDAARVDDDFQTMLARGVLADYPHVGVLMGASADQTAFEWSRVQGGVFSHVLRSGMRGAADVDEDGRIVYGELHGFVLSALEGVPSPYRQKVLIRPPAKAPLAALVEHGETRRLRVGSSGRVAVWGPHGMVAEAHREAPYSLTLPPNRPLEAEVNGARFRLDGEQLVPEVARGHMAERSAGVADAVHRGLFALPFDASYYRAFARLVDYPVPARTTGLEAGSAPEASRIGWSLEGSLSGPLVAGEGVAFGGGGRVGYSVLPWLNVTAGVDLERHPTRGLAAAPTLMHVGVPVGVELSRNWSRIGLLGRAEAGYSAVTSSTAAGFSADPAAWHARAMAGVQVQLFGSVWFVVAADSRVLVVTVDGREKAVGAAGGRVGFAIRTGLR